MSRNKKIISDTNNRVLYINNLECGPLIIIHTKPTVEFLNNLTAEQRARYWGMFNDDGTMKCKSVISNELITKLTTNAEIGYGEVCESENYYEIFEQLYQPVYLRVPPRILCLLGPYDHGGPENSAHGHIDCEFVINLMHYVYDKNNRFEDVFLSLMFFSNIDIYELPKNELPKNELPKSSEQKNKNCIMQ